MMFLRRVIINVQYDDLHKYERRPEVNLLTGRQINQRSVRKRADILFTHDSIKQGCAETFTLLIPNYLVTVEMVTCNL